MRASLLVVIGLAGIGCHQPTPTEQAISKLEEAGAAIVFSGGEDNREPVGISLVGGGVTDSLLAELPKFPELRRLVIRDAPLTDAATQSLVHLTRLESLVLNNVQISDATFPQLAALRELRSLRLTNIPITDESLPTIAGYAKLEELDLFQLDITGEGISQLADLASSLQRAQIKFTGADEEALGALKAELPNVWFVY